MYSGESVQAVLKQEIQAIKAYMLNALETNKRLEKVQRERDRKRVKRERQKMLEVLNKLMQATEPETGRLLCKAFLKMPTKKKNMKKLLMKIAKQRKVLKVNQ